VSRAFGRCSSTQLVELEPVAAARRGDVRVVRAPGRVNLIGEHTDYNEGFVLPAAIDLEIRVAYVPTGDRRVELVRLDGGERDGFDLDVPRPRAGNWLDYVAGTAWALGEVGLATGLRVHRPPSHERHSVVGCRDRWRRPLSTTRLPWTASGSPDCQRGNAYVGVRAA
jgi:hypothetical protein